MTETHQTPNQTDEMSTTEQEKNEPKWTEAGFLHGPDGTQYCVQREQAHGAQSGWLIYYLLRRRPGEHELKHVVGTTRDRESRVRKIAERMVKEQLAARKESR